MIATLLDKGVNVFRLNFSHGSSEGHRQQAKIIRTVCAEKAVHAAILGDLQGPKIRLGDLKNEPLELVDDASIILSINPDLADKEGYVPVSYKPLPSSVGSGDTLLLDDGLIRLSVDKSDDENVYCTVEVGGLLKSRKGINRLGGGLSAPAITEKDLQDIDLAIELELDYLAVSFPCCADDLLPVKERLAANNAKIDIISKIERAEAVATDEVLLDLILASDGVMVARGDLGVEIGDAQLIGMQKKIIRFARRSNRPVITATQMMESMITSPIPTRAEVFDVANAVLDGTDAVMLSAETATGKFPAKVVAAMAETCIGAEKHPNIRRSSHRINRSFSRIDETIAMAAMYAANHLNNIKAIVCLTESGSTALFMSRLSSGLPIYGISRHQTACNRMALYRGVIPLAVDISLSKKEDVFQAALDLLTEKNLLKPGQRVCITCGDISHEGGLTNALKILECS
jgi:pyruvate kinase